MSLTAERIVQSPLHNPVDTLMQEEFSDPALWEAQREVLGGLEAYSGLRHPSQGWDTDTSRYILANSDQKWFAPVYGCRVAPDPEHPDDNGAVLQVASLQTMEAIHARLDATVLFGEHAHKSVLVTPPDPEGGISSAANNNVWLKTIKDGNWPVMATGQTNEDGTPEYNGHDYADYHTGDLLLFPRELQDMVSVAAGHELAWRQRQQAGEVNEDQLYLPGDQRKVADPFSSGFRGYNGYTNGITKIDNLTDTAEYFDLLIYATKGESGSSQTKALQEYWASGETTDPALRELKGNLTQMHGLIGDLLNFNTRHETLQNTTPEAIEAAFQSFLTGLARIADKLVGRYEGPVEDPPRPVAVQAKPAEAEVTKPAAVEPFDYDENYDDPLSTAPAEQPAHNPGRARRWLGALTRRNS
jgi:hypothetical protein